VPPLTSLNQEEPESDDEEPRRGEELPLQRHVILPAVNVGFKENFVKRLTMRRRGRWEANEVNDI